MNDSFARPGLTFSKGAKRREQAAGGLGAVVDAKYHGGRMGGLREPGWVSGLVVIYWHSVGRQVECM